MSIKKAVITTAGKGTRLYPITKIIPKVMLPLLDTPVIQLVVQEALDAGIEELLMIISPEGQMIKDYFENQPGPWQGKIRYILQPEARGLGDAIYHANQLAGNEPVAVLFGDSVFLQENPTLKLIDNFNQTGHAALAVQEIPDEDIPRRGVMDAEALGNGRYKLRGMVEKPTVAEAPSNLGFIARAVFNPSIFEALSRVQPDKKGEIQLTPAVCHLIPSETVEAIIIKEERLDIGNPSSYVKAIQAYANFRNL